MSLPAAGAFTAAWGRKVIVNAGKVEGERQQAKLAPMK
jgi:hypothetical protein